MAEPVNEGRAPGAEYDIALKTSARDPEVLRSVLSSWFSSKLSAPGLQLAPIATPEGTGVANETLIVDAAWSAGGRDLNQRFVVRVETPEPLYLDANIERHYKVYEALMSEPAVPSPAVIGYEADTGLIGAPFFAMEFIEGQIPSDRPHYTTAGFVFDASPAERRTLWENAVRTLAALHSVDTGRFAFLERGSGKSGLEEELDYFRRYLDWASPNKQNPHLEQAWTWLQANLPANPPTGFSWGDSRVANIIFRDLKPVAVLDWDTVSLAGSEADLAWWITMDHHATGLLPGIGTPDELIGLWQATTGRKVEHLKYHMVFSSFRLGAILYKLFDQMRAGGLMPAEMAEEQSTGNMFIQYLCQLLDMTPPGPIDSPLPEVTL